jgi:hypothetical protein
VGATKWATVRPEWDLISCKPLSLGDKVGAQQEAAAWAVNDSLDSILGLVHSLQGIIIKQSQGLISLNKRVKVSPPSPLNYKNLPYSSFWKPNWKRTPPKKMKNWKKWRGWVIVQRKGGWKVKNLQLPLNKVQGCKPSLVNHIALPYYSPLTHLGYFCKNEKIRKNFPIKIVSKITVNSIVRIIIIVWAKGGRGKFYSNKNKKMVCLISFFF